MLLNKIGYDPVDDESDSGYRRPPHDAASICDYFHALSFLEDEGEFTVKEMDVLINEPAEFFKG